MYRIFDRYRFSNRILGQTRKKHRFRTGGKPSTWFPPGGLVEHISDDQFLYKIQIAFWCKLEFDYGCEFMSLDFAFKLHRDSGFELIFFDFRFYFRLRIRIRFSIRLFEIWFNFDNVACFDCGPGFDCDFDQIFDFECEYDFDVDLRFNFKFEFEFRFESEIDL